MVTHAKHEFLALRGARILLVFFVFLFGLQLYPKSLAAQSVIDPRWQTLKQDDGLLSNDVLTILVDEGAIWFGTSAGVSRFDGDWQGYASATESQFATRPGPGQNVPPGRVHTLARAGSDGAIWMGTDAGWIARFEPSSQAWSPILNVKNAILTLQVVDSTVWVGTGQGLSIYEFDPAATTLTPAPLGDSAPTLLANAPVFAIQPHAETVWIGAQSGLWRHVADQWQRMPTPSETAYRAAEASWCNPSATSKPATQTTGASASAPTEINALWVDGDDALWIGAPFGAARFSEQTQCWNIIPTFKSNGEAARVQMLSGGENDAVWAATDGGGARKFMEHGQITLEFGQVVGNLNDFVRAVVTDQDGSVWFATPVGAERLLEWSWFNDPINGLQASALGDSNLNDIRDLLVDASGDLWIATGGGVRHKRGLTFLDSDEIFRTDNSHLPDNTVVTLAQDAEGAIWAGLFDQGIARFQDGEWSTPVISTALPSAVVTDLQVQGDTLWIGTALGLAQYDLAQNSLTIERQLADSVIESLALDRTGKLWVGTRAADIWQLQDAGAPLENSERWRVFPAATFQELSGRPEIPSKIELTLAAAPVGLDAGASDGMWVAIDRVGLFQWDGVAWRQGAQDGDLPTDFLWTLYSDPQKGELWVGNEAGVTQFDGESWGTLKDRDGLRSSAIYAIAGTREGGYWFGGKTGLSYYRPERSAPWVHLQGAPTGITALLESGQPVAEVGHRLTFNLVYGDLLTPKNELKVFLRLTGANAPANFADWREYDLAAPLAFEQPGNYGVEFRVRDQAFNYSQVQTLTLAVEPAALVVNVPWLGQVPRSTFQTLVALGLVSLLGFAYVSMEIVQGRRRATDAMIRSYNPYVSGEPVRREDMFFGRHNLLQRIIDTLHNNSIMIHGERRIGKTTLLYQLASRLEEVDDPDYWFVPIFIDLEGTGQELFFHFLIEEILHKVQLIDLSDELLGIMDQLHYHSVSLADYTDREFNRDLRTILRALQHHSAEHYPGKQLRLILLLDEMDVINGYDHLVQQQLRRIFMRDFAATLGAVVAGIQISREWDRIESPWYNLFNEIEVEPFTREQAIELLVEPVKNYYSYEPAALEFIIEQSEGRPFRLQQYALEAVTNMLAASRRRIKLADVQAAHRNIQSSVNHAHQDEGLLQMAAASSR
ncbi:MAG: hypothetical protein R3A44_05440 [Caldilineaceae bacterium]